MLLRETSGFDQPPGFKRGAHSDPDERFDLHARLVLLDFVLWIGATPP
jgi:hypothetical protein